MTQDQKQAELDKYLTLANATFDYLAIRFGRRMVCDDISTNEMMYLNQKVWAEKYFNERSLTKLKKLLTMFIIELKHPFDLAYINYIKENTGYDFDVWEENRRVTERVLKRGEIITNKERHEVAELMSHYNTMNENLQKLTPLRKLCDDFSKKDRKIRTRSSETIEETVQLKERVEKDGIIEEVFEFTSIVTVWDGPKPNYYNEQKEISPDGKRTLAVTQCASGKYSSTTIMVGFGGTAIQVYYAEGIHPNINAIWKDNNTIRIETMKSYTTRVQYKKVESYGDVITIEYIES